MNLWLKPSSKPIKIDLREFEEHDSPPLTDYLLYSRSKDPYFNIPHFVKVSWKPIDKYLVPFERYDQELEANIDYFADMMASGDPIEPLFVDEKGVYLGQILVWAAHAIGLKKVPVVDISQYRKKS